MALSRYCIPKLTRILFQALVYRDGNLVSGSLEALVQHMVPTEEYYPDRAYLFAFLLSARLFIKPHELLGEVCALCEHQQNLNGEGGKVSINTSHLRNDTKLSTDITHSRRPRIIVSSQSHASLYLVVFSFHLLDLFFHGKYKHKKFHIVFLKLLSPLLLLYYHSNKIDSFFLSYNFL